MKNTILIFSLLLSFSISIKAQVPGFVGKKFIVSGGMMFFPAFSPTYNNRQESQAIGDFTSEFLTNIPLYGMNWTKTLTADYAIARDMTVGMSLQNMRTSDYYSNQNYQSSIYYKDIRYVYANSIAANIKFFNENKGALAPIGNFTKLGLGLVLAGSYDSLDNKAKKAPTRNHFFNFTYGFGKTVIFQKCFTFTYGMDITIMLDKNIAPLDKDDPRIYTDASFYRIRKMQFLNAYTTIGYIF